MIAEALESAIRDEEHAAKIMCQREPDFVALYEVLGDKKAQDKIRGENKGVHHCHILVGDPNACETLPSDFGDVKRGSICPNNAYGRDAGLFASIEDSRVVVRHAMYLLDLSSLGLLPSLDQMPPEDFTLVCLMKKREKQHEIQMRQVL